MNIDQENRKMLAALKSAVSEALEKKRRLGQYAVVWQDNHPVIIENSDKKIATEASSLYRE